MGSRIKFQDGDEGSYGDGFAVGLLLGATVGALAAILFAPKSGEETRRQLKDLADQQKDNLKNQWEQTKAKASDAVGAAKEKLDTVAEQAKGAVSGYADKAKGTVDQVAENTNETVDKFQRRNDAI